MDMLTVESTLALAFGLGLLHALDADHVMAVSGLAAKKPSFKSCVRFCFHWATGHGLALVIIATGMVFDHIIRCHFDIDLVDIFGRTVCLDVQSVPGVAAPAVEITVAIHLFTSKLHFGLLKLQARALYRDWCLKSRHIRGNYLAWVTG